MPMYEVFTRHEVQADSLQDAKDSVKTLLNSGQSHRTREAKRCQHTNTLVRTVSHAGEPILPFSFFTTAQAVAGMRHEESDSA